MPTEYDWLFKVRVAMAERLRLMSLRAPEGAAPICREGSNFQSGPHPSGMCRAPTPESPGVRVCPVHPAQWLVRIA